MNRLPTTLPGPRGRGQRGTTPLHMALMALVLLAQAAAAATRDGPPHALVTIKPLHALVAGVMHGVGEPALLIEGGQSPHGFALRPSHARALDGADIVFWIGPALETSLSRVLGHGRADSKLVALAPQGSERDASSHGDEVEPSANAEQDHEHEHGQAEPHPWLDPRDAQRMVGIITSNLSALDPANAARYDANAARLTVELSALDGELASMLAPVAHQPFVVFHDAYRALQRRYGLNAVGAVRINPQTPAGAGHVSQLTHSGAVCVFAEPQFEPALVRRLAEDTGVRVGTLDPLGAALPAGPALYFDLMRSNARELVRCLSAQE